MKLSATILLLLFALFQVGACKKALNKKPASYLSTPETLEDLQAILDDNYVLNYDVTPGMPETSADNFFFLPGKLNNLNRDFCIYTWQFYPANDLFSWLEPYTAIYYANACLDYLPRISRTNENKLDWDNIKGSALYYRAYHSLQLCWCFAKAYDTATAAIDPGIVLAEGTDINTASVRSTVQECYNKIIADTKESLLLLTDVPLNVTRPSKAAAYGLLARTYLSMRAYDSAFKYADNCLQLNGELMDYNGDAGIDLSLVAGNGTPFLSFNKETVFYTTMGASDAYFRVINGGLADTLLYESYNANDLRRSLFFTASQGYYGFRGTYSIASFSIFSGIATDEMYLTRAECYARAENKEAALSDLNSLLMKRYKTGTFTPITTATAAEALDTILVERRKELIFRGLRWMDIKRLNKENRNIKLKRVVNGQEYELLPNSDKYALPIPQDIIEITGMLQNPGWL